VRYSLALAYLLWFCSGFGALGFHRFYLGKIGTGLIWMFSGGLCGIGCIFDAATLPRQVREANVRFAVDARVRSELGCGGSASPGRGAGRREDPEKTVLRVAKANGGFVSPGEAALEGDLGVDEFKELLEKMAAKGHAEMRVRSNGVVVYFFPEFSKDGRDDFAV